MSALKKLDRALATATWLTAAVLVVMLFAGPAVIAEDKLIGGKGAAPYAKGAGGAPDGAQLFKDNCGTCHTLSAAGTSGTVGPNLDQTSVPVDVIVATVHDGRGAMPAFADQLSDAEIKAVAAYVDRSR